MVRKCLAVMVALSLAVGSMFAAELKGTFVKFADGKLTIKVDDKEKTLEVPADLKVKRKGKNGNEMEIEVSKMLGKVTEGTKVTVEEEGGKVKDIKLERGKKKDN